MAFQMTATQKTTVRPQFYDSKGNPAPVHGAPQWSCDNTDVLALKPSADAMMCDVLAAGPIGQSKLTMRADADMGAGVAEIIGLLDIEITAGTATTVKLEADAPTEQ